MEKRRSAFWLPVGAALSAAAAALASPAWPCTPPLDYRIDERDSAGLAYDARDRVAPGASPQSELTAFWARKLDRDWKSQAYVLKGFANGSPDWGAGLSLVRSF